MHSPVDLAERVATMDIITGGRYTLSAALGYRDEEYDAFGVDRKHRVSRFVECLEVMKRLWTGEEVTFHGRHFHLQGARMTLEPIQKPHPPIWIAANSDAAIKRAGRLGYTWNVNPHATYTTIKGQIQVYREAAEEAGTEVPRELPIGRELYVHEDRERAFDQVRPFLGGKYEAYARWGQGQGPAGGGVLPHFLRGACPGQVHHRRPRGLHRRAGKIPRPGDGLWHLPDDMAGDAPGRGNPKYGAIRREGDAIFQRLMHYLNFHWLPQVSRKVTSSTGLRLVGP